ncbi:hypothetical protein Tco_0541436 [Tanacetum coccineum]
MNEEAKAQIARDEEIPRRWVEEEENKSYKFFLEREGLLKRQKFEEDAEKEELKGFLDIIPRRRVCTKMLQSLSTISIYCGLEDFYSDMKISLQDVEELYRLVKERYSASRPEGYDLMPLWR